MLYTSQQPHRTNTQVLLQHLPPQKIRQNYEPHRGKSKLNHPDSRLHASAKHPQSTTITATIRVHHSLLDIPCLRLPANPDLGNQKEDRGGVESLLGV